MFKNNDVEFAEIAADPVRRSAATADLAGRIKRLSQFVDHGDANHVNDPSVVKVGETFFMLYTRAPVDVRDEIAPATSTVGRP